VLHKRDASEKKITLKRILLRVLALGVSERERMRMCGYMNTMTRPYVM